MTELGPSLDRTLAAPGPGPAWLRVHDRLAQACREGLLAPGQRLPGEFELASLFGVSRMTLRRALARLQLTGILQARNGVGVFVRDQPPTYRMQSNASFAESLAARGGAVETRILRLARAAATAAEAAVLGLRPGAAVIALTRLRLLDGRALYLAEKRLPAARFPDFDDRFVEGASLSATYRAHGIAHFQRTGLSISGGYAAPAESAVLGLPDAAPVMIYRYVNRDEGGSPIEASRGIWPLDAIEVTFPDDPR